MSQLNQIIALVNNWQKKKEDRFSWDEYFMATAFLISSRSPDNRLKVGCVLVKNNHIISLGYNGFLPSLPHRSHMENGHELATVHSEQNCIADCSKRGVATLGAIAYVTHYPCINCFKILAAGGISSIYYKDDYHNHPLVNILAQQAKIQITKLDQTLHQALHERAEAQNQTPNQTPNQNHYPNYRGLPKIKSQPKMTFFGNAADPHDVDPLDFPETNLTEN